MKQRSENQMKMFRVHLVMIPTITVILAGMSYLTLLATGSVWASYVVPIVAAMTGFLVFVLFIRKAGPM